jgi:hypothetical protein
MTKTSIFSKMLYGLLGARKSLKTISVGKPSGAEFSDGDGESWGYFGGLET